MGKFSWKSFYPAQPGQLSAKMQETEAFHNKTAKK